MILVLKLLQNHFKYVAYVPAFVGTIASFLTPFSLTFKVAAGMFEYVKVLLPTFYTQSPTWDMSAEALAGYSSIMLAQAQECIFLKAEHG